MKELNKNLFLLASIIVLFTNPCYGDNLSSTATNSSIIGCINNLPVFRREYDRLFQSELAKFQKKYIFDPWTTSSYQAMKDRYNLIEETKSKNTTFYPNDLQIYKSIFEQKSQDSGEPINTYDLNSYAEDNARLLSYFRKKVSDKIINSITEKELASQEARKIGLRVEAWEINQRIYQVKSKYKTETEYQSFLRRNNSTELELKQALEQQILFEKLQNKLTEGIQTSLVSSDTGNEKYQQWLQNTKAQSKIVFSLDGTDPALQLCSIPKPRPKPVDTVKAKSITSNGQAKASSKDKKSKFFKKFWKFGDK